MPPSRESLVMTSPYERSPSAQTLGEGEGRLKRPFIFYEVGGAGGIWGGHRKKKRP